MPRPLFGGKTQKSIPWQPLPHMEDYLEELRVNGKNKDYIRQVKQALSHFGVYCSTENLLHPNEIERRHLLRFQAYINDLRGERSGEQLSLRYRQQMLKGVQYWLTWCEQIEVIDATPWKNIKIGQVKKKPNPLEEDEIDQLFAAHRKQAFSMDPFYFHRREVILTLLYGWGLRINELQSLTVAALDMRQEFVKVRNKGPQGTRTKTLPYADVMKQSVGRYLKHRGGKARPGEDSLLIDKSGNQMTLQMIYTVVTDLGQRAGVTINPHRLRDTFGTTMLDNDVPVERIMEMMGHSTTKQTLAYSRLNDPKLKESHDIVMNTTLSRLLNEATKEAHHDDADRPVPAP